MVFSVSEGRRQAKKTARTFWGARAGRPVTQLVLKLSAGGFHLNRSIRIDATEARMLLRMTTFFENPQTITATCNLAGAFWWSAPK
jgi:hypothetical protein